jgi:iron complex outermembrane receptor protein
MSIEVTTVGRSPDFAWRVPAAVYVITREQIERSGATTLPEALRLAPGVQVARIDAGKWAIGSRGFADRLARSIRVLIDGRAVYSPLFAGTYWETQDVLLEDIERIEVVRGPGGTLWGSNAVNGTISIITRRASDSQGAYVTAGVGDEQRNGAVRYGRALGGAGFARVYAKGFEWEPQVNTAGGTEYDGWRMGQAGLRIDTELTGGRDLTVIADGYLARLGKVERVTLLAPPYLETVLRDAPLSGANVLTRWSGPVREGIDFQLQTYYEVTDRNEYPVSENRRTFDVDLQLRHLQLPRQRIDWGLAWQVSHEDLVTASTVSLPLETEQLFSAFIEDEISLFDDEVRLTLGTKLEHNVYSGLELQPGARAAWLVDDANTVWASVTRAVRRPSGVERRYSSLNILDPGTRTFVRLDRNPDFVPEKLISYEAGYRLNLGERLYARASVFYNDWRDLLSTELFDPVTEPSPPGPDITILPLFLGNGIDGSSHGVELSADVRLTPWWHANANYSYLRVSTTPEPGSRDASLEVRYDGGNPRHQVRVHNSFDLPGRVQLDWQLRYVARLWGVGIPAYTESNARVGWQATDELEVHVTGQNLHHDHHAEWLADSGTTNVEIERRFFMGLKWRR